MISEKLGGASDHPEKTPNSLATPLQTTLKRLTILDPSWADPGPSSLEDARPSKSGAWRMADRGALIRDFGPELAAAPRQKHK